MNEKNKFNPFLFVCMETPWLSFDSFITCQRELRQFGYCHEQEKEEFPDKVSRNDGRSEIYVVGNIRSDVCVFCSQLHIHHTSW